MKKFVFLMLTCSSFMAAACAEDPESVGGPVTDGNSSENPSGHSGNRLSGGLSSSSSDGASINSDCWGPVTTTGYSYFSITRLVIGITYALNSGGGGGGGGANEFTELEQQDGCHNITGDARMDVATAAFVIARTSIVGLRARMKFAAKYAAGKTFDLTFPDGSVAKFEVGAYDSSEPLVAETAGSCT